MGLRDKAALAVEAQAAAEARAALATDGRYYCPTLPRASGLATGIDTWGLALNGIASAGWRLHSWAVAADGSARPLFERETTEAAHFDRVVDEPTITT